jgi:hypothetical protein
MRERHLSGDAIARLKASRRRHFADATAWMGHLEALGITGLKTQPDPVKIATEGALWGAITDYGLIDGSVILSDDAGQFNVGAHALCWVHAERLVHKLDCFCDRQAHAKERIRALIWWLYADLKAYKKNPTRRRRRELVRRFDDTLNRNLSPAGACRRGFDLESGFSVTALGLVECRQVVEARGHIWMLGSQGLFHDRQRTLVKRRGLRVAALGLVESRKVVEARGHVRMLGSQGLLPDRQRSLVERLGLRVAALGSLRSDQDHRVPRAPLPGMGVTHHQSDLEDHLRGRYPSFIAPLKISTLAVWNSRGRGNPRARIFSAQFNVMRPRLVLSPKTTWLSLIT